jgi:hypothetical protein
MRRGRATRAVALTCGLAALAPTVAARPASCSSHSGGQVTAQEARERVLWINRQLEEETLRGRVWADSWAIGIGGAGVASLAAVPYVAPDKRVDWYTSAGTAAVGVLPFVIAPLKVIRSEPALRETIAVTPLDDDARVCSLVVDAERTLREAADNERTQRRWFFHAGNIAFNTGVFLFLGLGFHHWSAGAINGLAGAAVGEAIIFTQPMGAIEAAEKYARF